MLWVRANPRPLLFLRTPHICWVKWSRICSNSKHSRDITVVTQWLKISQLCYISAMRQVRANTRPLRPTNMGGPQEAKWPQICSNSKHKKVMCGGGGGWGPTTEWRKIRETGHPSVISRILGLFYICKSSIGSTPPDLTPYQAQGRRRIRLLNWMVNWLLYWVS